MVGHVFNVTTYKKMLGFISKYASQHIMEENKAHYSCTIKSTHDLSCSCELI